MEIGQTVLIHHLLKAFTFKYWVAEVVDNILLIIVECGIHSFFNEEFLSQIRVLDEIVPGIYIIQTVKFLFNCDCNTCNIYRQNRGQNAKRLSCS